MTTDNTDTRIKTIRRHFQLLEAHARCEENVISQPYPDDGKYYSIHLFILSIAAHLIHRKIYIINVTLE